MGRTKQNQEPFFPFRGFVTDGLKGPGLPFDRGGIQDAPEGKFEGVFTERSRMSPELKKSAQGGMQP
jgi:hypothetical protein